MGSALLGTALAAAAVLTCSALAAPGVASAQATALPSSPQQWLQRWQHAAATHAYGGTIVTSGERGNLRSARIWHAVRNGQQIERIDNLAGAPRSVYRTDQAMSVVLPEQKLVRHRSNMPRFQTLFGGMAPLTSAQQAEVGKSYRLVSLGAERVANHEADVVGFLPGDGLRHAFRFWSDTATGLLLKWQMLEPGPGANPFAGARMLREVAFSDVQIPAPLRYELIENMLQQAGQGYAAQQKAFETVALQSLGWGWRKPLPGYVVTHCFARQLGGRGWMRGGNEGETRTGVAVAAPASGSAASRGKVTQCMLSDGLSAISLFIEPASGPAQAPRALVARGALRAVSAQYGAAHTVTAVGEVPEAALQEVLNTLYRPKG